jgi:SMI1/KNR4 family protein SUKH-1
VTDQQLDDYIAVLERQGWRVELTQGDVALSALFCSRHPKIPDSYMKFLQRVASCANASETVWFLCAADYNGASDAAWRWDEMEKIDLEGARDDAARSAIASFWNRHLPFMYSVGGDYAYLAFRVGDERFGSVVDGYDIELTSVSDVAPSFDDFVRLHGAALRGDFGDTVLRDYV